MQTALDETAVKFDVIWVNCGSGRCAYQGYGWHRENGIVVNYMTNSVTGVLQGPKLWTEAKMIEFKVGQSIAGHSRRRYVLIRLGGRQQLQRDIMQCRTVNAFGELNSAI